MTVILEESFQTELTETSLQVNFKNSELKSEALDFSFITNSTCLIKKYLEESKHIKLGVI
jgi:hypothetical protein